MKQVAFYILGLLSFTSCKQPVNKIINKGSQNVERIKNTINNTLKTSVSLTNSAKLIKHLDSLPKIKFPYESEWYNRSFPTIDISDFKNKKLFKIRYKLIETQIGGGLLDDDRIDSTFNLADTISYKAGWNLIEKTPQFVVIEVNDGVKLVTLTYNLKVIDAINSAVADPSGNSHFNANRHSTIYKNLKIVLHHEYSVQVDERGNFEKEEDSEKWFIDKMGHFQKNKNQK